MSYLVFARKWRPQTFDEVVGQEHIATTLKNAIINNRVAHAYLFSGPRGIGKTTTARIFAKALNCQNGGPTPTPCNKCESCIEIAEGRSLDVIEIDAASNRGIDEVRELRENVKFKPSVGLYKVYIIDEVHMLTPEAFNALLKTLEEPPKHIIFIFATTQRHKVLPTILSRCQGFDFKRISIERLISKLRQILEEEKLEADEAALLAIAKAADGSMRDAESILDQLVSFCQNRIASDDVILLLGSIQQETLFQTAQKIIDKDTQGVLELIDRVINDGKDITQFIIGLLEHFRNLIMTKVLKDPRSLIDLPKDAIDKIYQQAKQINLQDLLYIFDIISNAYEMIRRSAFARVRLEMAIIKLTKRESIATLEQILKELSGQKTSFGPDNSEALPTMDSPLPDAKPQPQDFTDPETEYNPPSANSLKTPDISTEGPIEPDGVVMALDKEQSAAREPLKAGLAKDVIASEIDTKIDQKPPQASKDNGTNHTSTEGNLELEQINKMWPEVLKRIKAEKISAALFLLEGRLLALEGLTLSVSFTPQFVFYKEALERNGNKTLVQNCMKITLGKDYRIKFTIIDNSSIEASPNADGNARDMLEEGSRGIDREKASVDEKEDIAREKDSSDKKATPAAFNHSRLLTDPIIQSALDIFKGRIVKQGHNLRSKTT